METINFIIELIIGVGMSIGLIYYGIFIGREFGTFEKFVIKLLDILKDKLNIK